MACANQSREKYAGVYHCDSSSRTTISFFGKTQINGWGIQDINLNEDGTVRANGEIQEGVTWSVKDSEIIFTNGEQEEVMQISDDDTELISGDLTFKKSR